MKQPRWSPADKAAILLMWMDGETAQAIANKLGVTKNTIIGLVHRMGSPARDPAKLNVEQLGKQRAMDRRPVPPPEPIPAKPSCMFALNSEPPFQFCGEPGYPWCARHRSIVYVGFLPGEKGRGRGDRKGTVGQRPAAADTTD